jgi:hypothetical protein
MSNQSGEAGTRFRRTFIRIRAAKKIAADMIRGVISFKHGKADAA